MGIVSVLGLFGGLALAFVLLTKINLLRKDEPDEDVSWGLKLGIGVGAFLVTVGVTGIIHSYFYKIETPFDPPEAELRDEAEPVKDPEPAKVKTPEKQDLVKGAKEEHRSALDDFQKHAGSNPDPEKP